MIPKIAIPLQLGRYVIALWKASVTLDTIPLRHFCRSCKCNSRHQGRRGRISLGLRTGDHQLSSISGVLLILHEKDWKKISHGRHPNLEATFKPCFVFPGWNGRNISNMQSILTGTLTWKLIIVLAPDGYSASASPSVGVFKDTW